eukprot:CAMPEP_0172451892 /NCGR_PEP_ID=MMETSP1065-20121228/9727_1 /TAXON_ID=265537 /ORGANISM="Amphiprora paludosa, Strain CCMP125" /LENGTH=479 /DNA_ID=CAMNT_0013203863 /DNA_START=395 /DNA_END=1834 /DNA_ORIENTATION=-
MSDPLFGGNQCAEEESDGGSSEEELIFEDEELEFGVADLEEVDLECGTATPESTIRPVVPAQQKSQETRRRSPASLSHWPLRIKSTRDVLIRVRPCDTVGQMKEAVLQALGEDSTHDAKSNKKDSPERRYVRLVCKGRLLAPDNTSLKDLKFVQPNDVVHAVLTAAPQQRKAGVQAAIQQGDYQNLSRRALRSAGINAMGMAVRRNPTEQEQDDDESSSSGEENDVENANNRRGRARPTTRQQRGFERLRLAGLSRGEISAIRAYFSRQVDQFVEANPELMQEFNSEADVLVRRQMQEEAWMFSQGPTSEFRLNLPAATFSGAAGLSLFANPSNNGDSNPGETDANNINPWVTELRATAASNGLSTNITNENVTEWPPSRSNANGNSTQVGNDRDFLAGFMLGFFVGFLMLVWVWMPTVPHKQKLGILTGITVQLALNTLRPQPNENDNPLDVDSDGLHGIPNAYYKLGQDMDDAVVLG